MKAENWKTWFKNGNRYRYAVVVLLFGVLLMFLPRCGESDVQAAEKAEAAETPKGVSADFSVAEEEKRLKNALRHIEGIGEVEVLLSLKSTMGRELAETAEGTLVLSEGSGSETVVELYETCPEYLGAVVVCSGANKSEVALAVTRAVQAYTGLGSDKITVIKGGAD